jgi:iron complex outermembrane receptor protein
MLGTRGLLTSVSAATFIVLGASAAFAQSTSSQVSEVQTVVVKANAAAKSVDGLVAETIPKSRSTITQEFISTQTPGQTIIETLKFTPGLSFTNNDPYGSSGGNLRLRGFEGPRISLTFDGLPINDTGNYAIYTNQQLDPELIAKASVNMGTTDVDSPTASAVGGTINYTTITPTDNFSGLASVTAGSFARLRYFGELNTGKIGPFGTKAYVAFSDQSYDKFKGPGTLTKKQYNARIYQDLGNGDFASLSVHFNRNRNNNYFTTTLANWNAFGRTLDYLNTCQVRTLNTATGTATLAAPAQPGNCTDFYGRQVNPSDTGNVRGQFLYHILPNLRFTFDPSFQYVLADGGGQLGTMSETDGRVKGTAGVGKDLNGNGTTTDTVAFFTPSVTNTHRWGVTTSLIWDLNDTQRVRVAYTGDFGRHRQTGEYTTLNADGTTTNIFGGKTGYGQKVLTSDGSFLRGRDRFSRADLNQVAVEYRGRFIDNRLTINAGLRAPYFSRELNQFCYSQDGSSNVRCTTEAPNATLANGNVTFAGTGTTQYIKPYSTKKKYDDLLPNIGASYELANHQFLYVSYAQGFSAPRTDSLYTVKRLADGTVSNPGVQPETTKTYDIGYRYQSSDIVAQVALWTNSFENRIVSAYDEVLGVSVDRNVGSAKGYGLDAQIAWKLTSDLSVFGSAAYNHSTLDGNVPLSATVALPTKNKYFVETPSWTYGGGVDWKFRPNMTVSADFKYTGSRFSTDVNDEKVKPYTIVDASLRYDLPIKQTPVYLQLNATNLLRAKYFGSISSRNNAVTIPGVQTGSSPSYNIGAPCTVSATLVAKF